MPTTFYSQTTDLLKAHGFIHLRAAKGSHEIWYNEATGKKITVPFNLKSRHTANAILKSAGSNKKL